MYIISLSTLEYHQTLLDSKSCKKKIAADGKGAYNTTISFGKDLLSNGGKMSPINLLSRKGGGGLYIQANSYINEAFQGVKATSDTALKTGDMGLSKH